MTKKKRVIAILALACVFVFQACITPSWVVEVEDIVQVTIPIVGTIGAVLTGNPLVGRITASLSTVLTLLQTYQKNSANASVLGDIRDALAAANADLAQLEAAANVQDPATQKKIQTILTAVIQELQAIAAILPAPTVAMGRAGPTGGVQGLAKVKIPASASAKTYKANLKKILAEKTGDPATDSVFQSVVVK